MTKQTELGNRYALTTLRRRRAELAGEIASLEKSAAWKRTQLAHVDAALELLGSEEPDKIRPVKPYKRIALFKQGELSQAVRDVLRRAGKPMRTPEIAAAVVIAIGADDRALPAMTSRVRASLEYLTKHKGSVVKLGDRLKTTWALKANTIPVAPFKMIEEV
jgi:hypothetical protein